MIKSFAKQILPKSIWSFLRSKKIDHLINQFDASIREGNYGGHQLKISIEDPLGRGWYGKDWERLKEIELLSTFNLKEGAKVFDLGAHQSVVAMMIAKEVGATGQVLAVEANKHNYQVGINNRDLNKLNQLSIINCAVGQTNGTIEFSDDLNGAIKSEETTSGSTTVNSYTIDHLVKNYFTPDVIFMDIEGFEVHALKSASVTFASKPDWFVEVHGPDLIGRFGGTVSEVMDFFLKSNYQIHIALEGEDFTPYDPSNDILNQRFLMVATSPRS